MDRPADVRSGGFAEEVQHVTQPLKQAAVLRLQARVQLGA